MRRDQFLQPQVFEIHAKEVYKITIFRIVAVAEDDFVFEVLFVVLKLLLDVDKSCVELVVLFIPRFVHIFYGAFSCRFDAPGSRSRLLFCRLRGAQASIELARHSSRRPSHYRKLVRLVLVDFLVRVLVGVLVVH